MLFLIANLTERLTTINKNRDVGYHIGLANGKTLTTWDLNQVNQNYTCPSNLYKQIR